MEFSPVLFKTAWHRILTRYPEKATTEGQVQTSEFPSENVEKLRLNTLWAVTEKGSGYGTGCEKKRAAPE
jgi:hypothetical protein